MADGRSICGSDDDHVLLSKTALAKTAFQKLQRNVIINWYNKKQQTLSFQGPDGPSLRDNFVDLVQKKPGTTTDLQDPGPSVSTKQTTHPSLREADGSQERNSRISINNTRSTNCSKERSNPDIVANIGGLKLDFLILPKQIEENTRLLSTIKAQTQNENAFCTEVLDCKKTCETNFKCTLLSLNWSLLAPRII